MIPAYNDLTHGQKYALAEAILMTGPRAQKPTHRAVLKTMGRLKRGEVVGSRTWGSWRDAPAIVHDHD